MKIYKCTKIRFRIYYKGIKKYKKNKNNKISKWKIFKFKKKNYNNFLKIKISI